MNWNTNVITDLGLRRADGARRSTFTPTAARRSRSPSPPASAAARTGAASAARRWPPRTSRRSPAPASTTSSRPAARRALHLRHPTPASQTFVDRWASPDLIGVDFDIEAGQSQAVIDDLVQRIQAAHAALSGAALQPDARDAGQQQRRQHRAVARRQRARQLQRLRRLARWRRCTSASTARRGWPSYVTVNLMTMDYGAPAPGVCVVSGGACDMGQSAIQAAYNLHDQLGRAVRRTSSSRR